MDFNITKISIATLISTTLMTMFSYALGFIRRKKFSEPELLNDLLGRWSSQLAHVKFLGWLIHYVVGFFFIFLYQVYWTASDSHPTVINGIMLGAVNGVIGICGWKFSFALHPNPPSIDFKEYYMQLFFAHVIFGVTATAVFIRLTSQEIVQWVP